MYIIVYIYPRLIHLLPWQITMNPHYSKRMAFQPHTIPSPDFSLAIKKQRPVRPGSDRSMERLIGLWRTKTIGK